MQRTVGLPEGRLIFFFFLEDSFFLTFQGCITSDDSSQVFVLLGLLVLVLQADPQTPVPAVCVGFLLRSALHVFAFFSLCPLVLAFFATLLLAAVLFSWS